MYWIYCWFFFLINCVIEIHYSCCCTYCDATALKCFISWINHFTTTYSRFEFLFYFHFHLLLLSFAEKDITSETNYTVDLPWTGNRSNVTRPNCRLRLCVRVRHIILAPRSNLALRMPMLFCMIYFKMYVCVEFIYEELGSLWIGFFHC